MKEKVLRGFGDEIRIGDYVRMTLIDHGKYGTKGPKRYTEKKTFKITYFGRFKLSYIDSSGNTWYAHFKSPPPESWRREFKLATKKQIRDFNRTYLKSQSVDHTLTVHEYK